MDTYGIRCSNTIVLLMHRGFMFSISKEYPFLRLLHGVGEIAAYGEKNGYSLNKQMMRNIFLAPNSTEKFLTHRQKPQRHTYCIIPKWQNRRASSWRVTWLSKSKPQGCRDPITQSLLTHRGPLSPLPTLNTTAWSKHPHLSLTAPCRCS